MRMACALLGLIACGAAFAGSPLGCSTSLLPLKFRPAPPDAVTGHLPLPDYQQTLLDCLGRSRLSKEPIPASTWLESERRRYSAVLAKQPVDILVVPFQIQDYGLDRIERLLMTADLAYALGDAGGIRVADPFLAALALGEGERRIEPRTAERIAQSIGARWILSGYVGHDLEHHFTLTLILRESGSKAGSKPWQRDWRAVAFTEERTPAYVLHDMLPEIVKELPLGLTAKPAAHVSGIDVPSKIEASPAEIVAASTPPNRALPMMNLLAATVPSRSERAHERLFVRALLLAMRSSSTEPKARFFESYSLLNLHRRPVALARIEGAAGPSFDALRALLNGNVPAARDATAKVKNKFEQLLLQLLLLDLEFEYGVEEPTQLTAQTLFAEQAASAWGLLFAARLEDRNKWFRPDARWVKAALDDAFPIAGLELESVVRGNIVTRREEPDQVEIDLANIRHISQVVSNLESTPCCSARSLRPGRWDLLWAIGGAAENRFVRSLETMIFVLGVPRDAVRAIERYKPVLDGHIFLTALSAAAAVGVAEKSPDDERAHWSQLGLDAGRAALRWSPGQTRASYAAALSLGIPSRDSEIWLDVYGYDFPRRTYWPFFFLGVGTASGQAREQALASEAHAFSTSDLEPFSHLRGKDREAALMSMGSRFLGHRAKPTPQQANVEEETVEEKIRTVRAATKEDPNKNLFLGGLLFRSDHSLEEAFNAYLAYPRFSDRDTRDRVALANQAFDIGSKFFWLGRGKLAKPFFQIAAELNTGSDASMASQQRLLLLAGDYRGAAQAAQGRAIRYFSSYAQRDFLSLLHAFGEHEAAWSAFSQLRLAQENPALWTSALIGQRIQRRDERAVREWLMSAEIRNVKFKTQQFASYYAILWNATDRTPPADLVAFVEELEGESKARVDTGMVIRPHPVDPTGVEFLTPTFKPKGKAGAASLPDGTPVKSERAYFAEAYSALARRDFANAAKWFAEMSSFYPLNDTAMSYFAYAASKTGDEAQLETYVMAPRKSYNETFDVLLSRAFFAVSHKQVDEAYRLLRLAFRKKPYESSLPIDTHYQFAQACEWLYRDTKDERFSATLLEWAKDYQSVQPMSAWAYAIEYQYEANPTARTRALAMTLYLDPLSERIKGTSEADIEKARAWLAANNPFGAQEKDDEI